MIKLDHALINLYRQYAKNLSEFNKYKLKLIFHFVFYHYEICFLLTINPNLKSTHQKMKYLAVE